MSKYTFVAILGLLVALTPYLGFPQDNKTIIFVFSGLLIAFTSYLTARENHLKAGRHEVFEENDDFQNNRFEGSGLKISEEIGESDIESQQSSFLS